MLFNTLFGLISVFLIQTRAALIDEANVWTAMGVCPGCLGYELQSVVPNAQVMFIHGALDENAPLAKYLSRNSRLNVL